MHRHTEGSLSLEGCWSEPRKNSSWCTCTAEIDRGTNFSLDSEGRSSTAAGSARGFRRLTYCEACSAKSRGPCFQSNHETDVSSCWGTSGTEAAKRAKANCAKLSKPLAHAAALNMLKRRANLRPAPSHDTAAQTALRRLEHVEGLPGLRLPSARS